MKRLQESINILLVNISISRKARTKSSRLAAGFIPKYLVYHPTSQNLFLRFKSVLDKEIRLNEATKGGIWDLFSFRETPDYEFTKRKWKIKKRFYKWVSYLA